MSGIKDIASGTIITLIIGGAAYTVSQSDIIDNFASETGLTQEQAEQYVNEIPEDELMSYNEAGSDMLAVSQIFLDSVKEIDCLNYTYEWETPDLSCSEGKTYIRKLGNESNKLGLS